MTIMIRFRCYYCHRIHTVSDDAAGKRGRCVCGKLMLVPSASSAAEAGQIPLALPPVVAPDPAASDVEDIQLARGGAAEEPISRAAATGGVAAATPILAPDEPGREPVAIRAGDTATLYTVPRVRKGGSRLLGFAHIILSLVALGAWVLHEFFSGRDPAMGRLLWARDPSFLGLPAPFWSTVFFALFAALFLEGIYRMRRA